MKLILFSIISLVIVFIFFACKTKKSVTQTTEEKAVPTNPILSFCDCQNSKSLTIEEYAMQESKKAGVSIEEYTKNFNLALASDSWLVKEFIADPTFMNAAKSKLEQAANEGAFGNKETVEQSINELREKHPICGEAFLMMITGVVGAPKE